MFGGVGRFLKRQAMTKSGKQGLSLLAGTLAMSLAGEEVGGMVGEQTFNALNGVFNPTTAVIGLGVMFLRDRGAKTEEAKRRRLPRKR